MKILTCTFILMVAINLLPNTGSCQFKKIPTTRDTLDFPNDFRNKTGIPIGDDLTSFTYIDIEADSVSLDDFKDELVVLNFWFVGCKGCKQEEPYLAKMTRSLQDKKINFISICNSSKFRTSSYIKKNGYFGYKVISISSKKEVLENFKVKTFATHLIVKNGKVLENFSFPLTTADEMEWYKDQILRHL